ncbi:MAG: class C sortase [Lachnospiraceae bacterium]
MKWIKNNKSTIILIFVLLIGISLLLYPSISDYWNSFHQSRAIATYMEAVEDMTEEEYEQMRKTAEEYNAKLLNKADRWRLSEEEEKEYKNILNVGGTGIMGYIEIPKIRTQLPIYHGIDESILQIAVGHLEGSSLPVGGESTHCVISGHRGLPSAKLFTDLDQLVEGDIFYLQILDETLAYEVDRILIVEPDDISALEIEEGRDYCTLVTCTPYGVNTHRLLVRGHRTTYMDASVRVVADAMQIEPLIVAPVVAAPMLLLLLIWLLVHYRKR